MVDNFLGSLNRGQLVKLDVTGCLDIDLDFGCGIKDIDMGGVLSLPRKRESRAANALEALITYL